MPGSANIFVDEGSSPDIVTQETNTANVETSILEVVPEGGTFLRLLNMVAKGEERGVPIYADLRDGSDDPLPAQTSFKIVLDPAGSTDQHTVSETVGNISVYNTLSVTDQRDADNVDSVKVVLERNGRTLDNVDWRDVDALRIVMESPAVIDWSNSALYVDSNAVEGPIDKRGV